MKKIIIAAASVFLTYGTATATAADSQVGRWQLFQGEYPFINLKGEEHKSRSLFKIDTVTGDIYECSAGQVRGEQLGKPGTIVQYRECRPFETMEFPAGSKDS